ncbi:MAG: DNA polymerase I, partial [Patescibacteria group bacterium]|nr:DNA polymerase I [Patescibacteria group bacterium]
NTASTDTAVAGASAIEPAVCRTGTAPPSDLTGQTVWVVDAHNLIYQVFHALPEMTSPRGEPVGAVFGFARDMLHLLEEKRPDYLFCAFDLPGGTFRKELFDGYKAQRAEMPEDLVPQIGAVQRLVRALGIPSLGCESYEADDVMATVATMVEQRGGQCFLVTSDKDCRQLISDRVKLYNIRKNLVIDGESLNETWGIRPDQVVDFQSLVGDSVDNVPGVPLIGPKFARELLVRFDTLDSVLEHADEVSGAKRKENLKTYRQQALLSRELVRLKRDVPVAIDWLGGRVGPIDTAAARSLFQDFGFRGIASRLDSLGDRSAATAEEPAGEVRYHLVDTPEKLAALVELLGRQTAFAFDTETTHLWPRWAELVGCSFATSGQEAWYVPVRAPAGEPCLDLEQTLAALRPVLEDARIEKVGQNLKYDMIVLRNLGVMLRGVAFDTMVASYLLDAGRQTHNLDDLALRYLNFTKIKTSEVIGAGRNQQRMDEVAVGRVAEYACEDAVVPMRLRPILAQRLEQAGLTKLFSEVEIPLIDVLVDLEFNGVKIDVHRLAELSRHYGDRMEAVEAEIHQLAGRRLNIASPKQLQQVLFEELKLPVLKKTPKTGPSTDADVLEELAQMGNPLPAKILEYRQYAKLKNTYVDALPKLVHPGSGRVHASFNQVVAATGRLSSSDPNLQNIPVRTEEGREIRSAFLPGQDGWLLLAADYSQIELRVLAHLSADERLCEAFARDEDVHTRVAGEVYGVPLDQVTSAMRREAKAVNFGIIYGQGPGGLARSLGIERDQAAEFIENYFRRYPGVERFFAGVMARCRQQGYVETILGRRRAISGIRHDADRPKNLPERTAVNTVIQGSAADLIKLAMLAVKQRLDREGLPARMLLQIHDELIFEMPEGERAGLTELVREAMASVLPLRVPLKVDVKCGRNWADAE